MSAFSRLSVAALVGMFQTCVAYATPFDLTKGASPTFVNTTGLEATDLHVTINNPFAQGIIGIGSANGGTAFPEDIEGQQRADLLTPFIVSQNTLGYTSAAFYKGTTGTGVPAGGSTVVDFTGFPANEQFVVMYSNADGEFQAEATFPPQALAPGLPTPVQSHVTVVAASSPVPEPGAILLLSSAMGIFGIAVRRNRLGA